MTNDEIQIAKETRLTKLQWRLSPRRSRSSFVLRHSFVLWISSLVIFLTAFVASGQTSAKKPPIGAEDFQPNIPLVFLEAKQPIVSELKVPCASKINYPKGSDSTNTSPLPGVVRFHGATSQGYPKKSFGVTLDAPASLAGMRASAHWVLQAAYVDRSLMRHKLSYDLFRSLSATNASRYASGSRFVEVYLNGSYHGVYLLMERVDRQLFGLRPFNSNDVTHACIYKAVDHVANFHIGGHAGYEQREPDPLAGEYWRPLDEFSRFVSSAPNAAFFHPQTGIASRLDLDNAIDFHLLVLLTSNMDGSDKNFIFARNDEPPGSPNRKFFFAPWDYDATFGRNWEASPVAATEWLSNHLFNRLLANTEYRARFVARWKQLRDHEFSAKTIQSMIDANARTLGDAARRNATRWPTATGYYPDQLTFAEDLAQMKSWIEARIKWLDRQILQSLGNSDK